MNSSAAKQMRKRAAAKKAADATFRKTVTLTKTQREKIADTEEWKNLSQRGRDYRFMVHEKDPIIDVIRTELQLQNGRITPQLLRQISYASGVTIGTLNAWLTGNTRFPRALTTRFVMEAIGITIRYLRSDGTEIRRNGV